MPFVEDVYNKPQENLYLAYVHKQTLLNFELFFRPCFFFFYFLNNKRVNICERNVVGINFRLYFVY